MILIVGARGSGKDVTAHQTARAIHQETGKRVYIDLDPKKYDLPAYFVELPSKEYLTNTSTEANDSICLLSDAHLTLYAREWGTDYNKAVDKLITVSRHKNIDFILSTQETSRLDKNVITAVDALIFKEPSLLAAEFERPEIRKLVEEANKKFEGKTRKEKWATAYAITNTGRHTITDIGLPFYWSEELSKRYGNMQIEPEEPEKRAAVLHIRRSQRHAKNP